MQTFWFSCVLISLQSYRYEGRSETKGGGEVSMGFKCEMKFKCERQGEGECGGQVGVARHASQRATAPGN